jgi:hypothetical protein
MHQIILRNVMHQIIHTYVKIQLNPIKFRLKIILIYWTSIINLNYAVPFNIFEEEKRNYKGKESDYFVRKVWKVLTVHIITCCDTLQEERNKEWCHLINIGSVQVSVYLHNMEDIALLECPLSCATYFDQSCKFEPSSWRGVLDTTLCDQVCQRLPTGRWFSPGTSVSSTNKTDRHDIT